MRQFETYKRQLILGNNIFSGDVFDCTSSSFLESVFFLNKFLENTNFGTILVERERERERER
jgi:hypothetical protein